MLKVFIIMLELVGLYLDSLRTAGAGIKDKGIALQNWRDERQFSGGKTVSWSKGWRGTKSSLGTMTDSGCAFTSKKIWKSAIVPFFIKAERLVSPLDSFLLGKNFFASR